MRREVTVSLLLTSLRNAEGISWSARLVYGAASKILSGVVLCEDDSLSAERALFHIREAMKGPVSLAIDIYGEEDCTASLFLAENEKIFFKIKSEDNPLMEWCTPIVQDSHIKARVVLQEWYRVFCPGTLWVVFESADPPHFFDVCCVDKNKCGTQLSFLD